MKLKVRGDTILDGISASMNFRQTNLCPLANIVLLAEDFWMVHEKNQDVFHGKEAVSLLYDNLLLCHGFVDSFNYNDELVAITMRNRASLLVDSHLNLPYQQKSKVTALNLIREIAALYNLSVNDYTGLLQGEILDNFSYEREQSAFEVIDKITNDKDVIVSSDAFGNLILNPRKQPILPVLLKGVTKMTFSQKNNDVYGQYKIFCNKEDSKGEVKEDSAVVIDQDANSKKVWIKNVAEQGDIVAVKKFVKHEKRIRRLNSQSFSATTSSITQSGMLLNIGQSVIVPFNNVSYELKIKSIDLKWNTKKEEAVYGLTGSGIDNLEGPKDKKIIKSLSKQKGGAS